MQRMEGTLGLRHFLPHSTGFQGEWRSQMGLPAVPMHSMELKEPLERREQPAIRQRPGQGSQFHYCLKDFFGTQSYCKVHRPRKWEPAAQD